MYDSYSTNILYIHIVSVQLTAANFAHWVKEEGGGSRFIINDVKKTKFEWVSACKIRKRSHFLEDSETLNIHIRKRKSTYYCIFNEFFLKNYQRLLLHFDYEFSQLKTSMLYVIYVHANRLVKVRTPYKLSKNFLT